MPRSPPVTSPYLSVPQHHSLSLHTASSHLCLSLHTVSSFGSFRLSMENARTWRGCKGGQSEKPPQIPAPSTANVPCNITQLRRALLLGLLCSPWVLTRCRRSSSNSVQREEGKRDASQALLRLFSTPSAATASGHSSPPAGQGRASSPASPCPLPGLPSPQQEP